MKKSSRVVDFASCLVSPLFDMWNVYFQCKAVKMFGKVVWKQAIQINHEQADTTNLDTLWIKWTIIYHNDCQACVWYQNFFLFVNSQSSDLFLSSDQTERSINPKSIAWNTCKVLQRLKWTRLIIFWHLFWKKSQVFLFVSSAQVNITWISAFFSPSSHYTPYFSFFLKYIFCCSKGYNASVLT